MAKIYQKIPGVGTGRGRFQIIARSRLYTAPDHLLVLMSTGYTEEYKRLFFRDIRSVEIRHNNGQFWSGLISGAITLLLLLLYFTAIPVVALGIICLPTAIWFLVNIISGETCDCYVSTNVQTLKLPVPRRVKKVALLIQYLRTKTAEFDSVAVTPAVA